MGKPTKSACPARPFTKSGKEKGEGGMADRNHVTHESVNEKAEAIRAAIKYVRR